MSVKLITKCFQCSLKIIIMMTYHSFATFLGGRNIRHDGRAERDVTLADPGDDTSNHEDSECGRQCPQDVRQRNTHLQQNTYFTREHRIYCIAVKLFFYTYVFSIEYFLFKVYILYILYTAAAYYSHIFFIPILYMFSFLTHDP